MSPDFGSFARAKTARRSAKVNRSSRTVAVNLTKSLPVLLPPGPAIIAEPDRE